MCNQENDEDKNFNNPLKIIIKEGVELIDFYLYEVIESIGQYIDFLRAISLATEKDIIKIHINCPGGDIDVAWNIYDELKSTKARVDIQVEGPCASAASIILLAADNWYINEHAYVMVHAWSSHMFGKRNELIALTDFEKKFLENKFKEVYKDFMTTTEIQECLDGKDFYFTAEEVGKRIESYQKTTTDQQLAIQKIKDKYQKLLDKEITALSKKMNKK